MIPGISPDVAPEPSRDESLAALLAARARSASDWRLALDVAGGLAVLTAALHWRPALWFLLACAASCFAAFGLWGIADREIASRQADRAVPDTAARRCGGGVAIAVFRVLRILATATGALAALAFGFALVFGAIGDWIS